VIFRRPTGAGRPSAPDRQIPRKPALPDECRRETGPPRRPQAAEAFENATRLRPDSVEAQSMLGLA
jgi:hypothetical protein